MFFITWYNAVVNLLSVDGWAIISINCLIVALLGLLLYLFATPLWRKKIGFIAAIIGFLFFLLSIVIAYQQQASLNRQDAAIIISSEVGVKNTPVRGGTDDFIIHAGTKVYIKDNSIPHWLGIVVPDGREGWILRSTVEYI